MNIAQKWIFGAIATGCLTFLVSPGFPKLWNHASAWEIREQCVFLSGSIAMALMVVSMLISIRLPLVNRWMHGLDKAYRVHKWTGIWSTVFVMTHWLFEKVPHILVEFNIIPNPGDLTDGSQYTELEIMLFQLGTTFAEVLVYVVFLLVGIALLRKIPYRFFRISHKIFPGIFLLLVFHAATAQEKEHWLRSPAGYLLFLLLAIGTVAACIGLFQAIGKGRQTKAVINQILLHPNGIMELRLQSPGKPFVYQPGQYAFLKFAHSKEPHPFSMISSGEDAHTLNFAIKGLGDFSKALPHHLAPGQPLRIEGPYGAFTFNDACDHQIWIAAGIGITPFLSRLAYLCQQKGSVQSVNLWYSCRGAQEEQFPSQLTDLCARADVRLHTLNSAQKDRFSLALLEKEGLNLSKASIWFCGPKAFAKELKQALKSIGFDLQRFHYDHFHMR